MRKITIFAIILSVTLLLLWMYFRKQQPPNVTRSRIFVVEGKSIPVSFSYGPPSHQLHGAFGRNNWRMNSIELVSVPYLGERKIFENVDAHAKRDLSISAPTAAPKEFEEIVRQVASEAYDIKVSSVMQTTDALVLRLPKEQTLRMRETAGTGEFTWDPVRRNLEIRSMPIQQIAQALERGLPYAVIDESSSSAKYSAVLTFSANSANFALELSTQTGLDVKKESRTIEFSVIRPKK